MHERCTSTTGLYWQAYGKRGITVDPRWNSFTLFLQDMGERPEGLSLDRIDNDKGYSKDNCRWATRQEQNSNKGLYAANKSGVSGVTFCKTQKVWIARANENGTRIQLYKGPDFNKATEARLTWDHV